MKFGFKFKYRFFNAFRELFVHHHGSLEFRAKIFALIIATNKEIDIKNYSIIQEICIHIYKNDEDRTNLLILTTKEHIKKILQNDNIDILISSIQKELKIVPRYAKKINIELLKPLLDLTQDKDTLSYQENILEFLQTLKNETLQSNKLQIEKDEKNLTSKY